MSYNTKQKDLILEVIKRQKKSFTIKTLEKELDGVGLTTIYRMVDRLLLEGIIKKELNNTYVYLEECDEHNHFYLKCDKCGCMIHVDCDCINDLTNHINNKHKFKINEENIIINGICNNCLKGSV